MSSEDQNAPKLLFLLSGADGELFNAMYMVMGCDFRTVFVLRDPSFSLNQNGLPGKCYLYQNVSDLLAIVEAEAPQVVCLFSGYLVVNDKMMDAEELDRFIAQMHSRGIKVITSDPFLGILSRLPPFDPHNPFEQFLAVPVRLGGMFFFGPQFPYFLSTAANLRSLKRIPHVYIVDPDEAGDIRRVAFFNPKIRRYVSESGDSRNGSPTTEVGLGAQTHWLFILGALEYRFQMDRCAAPGFHDLLAQKLRETLEEGSRPVLIAPTPCIEALAANASLNGSLLLDKCDYNRFMSLLIGAEYAFYWNIFSASTIARILNWGPTFFFASGHLADAYQPMFDKGISRYYANAHLEYRNQTKRLRREELAIHAALHETQLFNPFYENVRHLPSPNDIIHQLLRE